MRNGKFFRCNIKSLNSWKKRNYFIITKKNTIRMNESIYNLVPREYEAPTKEPMFQSKHNPDATYPGSTFGEHLAAFITCTN